MAHNTSPPFQVWDAVVPEPYSTMAVSFDYHEKERFLCRFQDVAIAVLGYFCLVRALKELMRRRKGKPFEFSTLVTLHNMFLTVVSTVLMVGFSVILIEKSSKFTPFEMICSPEFHSDGRLHTLYYLVRCEAVQDTGYEVGRLLTSDVVCAELSREVVRVLGYCDFDPQEQACHFPPRISPRCHPLPLLDSNGRTFKLPVGADCH